MTTNLMTRTAVGKLVGPTLAEKLASRIVTDHPEISLPMADRIVTQTAAFLATCGAHAGLPLVPSEQVDIGWHTFILHTEEYTEFCNRVAGRYLHHTPDEPEEGEPGKAAAARQRTLDAIEDAGYVVDHELWPDAAKCSQCYNGCSDSPVKK
jgi:hypothetical protein